MLEAQKPLMMSVNTAVLQLHHEMPSPRAADDELRELAARVAAGEAHAIAELYDAHHHAVRAFATRLLGEPNAAEDLVHDVFVGLPKAMRRWRGTGQIRTFLIGIAVNHARHHVRAARRRRAAMDKLAKQPQWSATETPEARLRREELARALQRALDKLPLRQRVAFVLCEVEERTAGDASEIVGVSVGTIKSRLHYAKAKLRTSLEKEGIR